MESDETTTHGELAKSNGARLQRLATQGTTIGGLREGYMLRLLEHLVGADLNDVKVVHELWVADQLDVAEQKAREAVFLNGNTPNINRMMKGN